MAKKYDYSNFKELRITHLPTEMDDAFEKIRNKKGIARSTCGKIAIAEFIEREQSKFKK